MTVENDRVTRVRGDRDDPISRGYICFKGRQAPEQHNSSRRLRRSLERVGGELVEGPSARLLDEAGNRLRAIVDEHGPGTVGFYKGTQSGFNSINNSMVDAFVNALGTNRNFITMTIDQSAKIIAAQRLGAWPAGGQSFVDSDVWMFVGANPLVSMIAAGGPHFFLTPDPVRTLRERREQGKKLIVIDPRRSETARLADLHVQPRPGRDAELMASVLHVVLRNGWHDASFCAEFVDDVDELLTAVEGFAPDACAGAIGVEPAEIVAVAELFARDSTSGMAGSGTGPNMARYSNLSEHLLQALNVVCGRYPREGEVVGTSGVLASKRPPRAGVYIATEREWELGPKSLEHGLGPILGTMMSSEIANEILHASESRMRALICVGGNPAVALPDQARTEEALSALELLVVIDPRLTATARHADYVFAPKIQYERPDHTMAMEAIIDRPFAHVTPALVQPPRDSDLVDDWLPLWSMARSCGIRLEIGGRELPTDEPPTAEDLFEIQTDGAPVAIADVAAEPGGRLFESDPLVVRQPVSSGRFALLATDVAAELAALEGDLAGSPPSAEPDEFLLTVRRHRETNNSTGADFDATRERMPGNPAYLHPEDMHQLGLDVGAVVAIVRGDRRIAARVAADATVRPGVVSVGHCRPGLSSRPWEASNALVDADLDVQTINRMPIMSGIPIRVEPWDESHGSTG